jgi:hypothetical protein
MKFYNPLTYSNFLKLLIINFRTYIPWKNIVEIFENLENWIIILLNEFLGNLNRYYKTLERLKPCLKSDRKQWSII